MEENSVFIQSIIEKYSVGKTKLSVFIQTNHHLFYNPNNNKLIGSNTINEFRILIFNCMIVNKQRVAVKTQEH